MNEPRSILIVDDDASVRAYMTRILKEEEFLVYEAEDGEACQKYLDQSSVSLVIVDMIMPKQEGLETIMSLRRKYPGIKIIGISGGFGADFLLIAEKLGAQTTLEKPFDRKTLLDAVNSCFDTHDQK